MPDRLLLVDGHAYAYRAFHAIRSLSAPDGSATNAIFGFVKMLLRLRAQLHPTHLGVIWDGGLDDQRRAALPEYKAQRPPMPDSLSRQIEALTGWLEAAGMYQFCEDGVEADDVIAHLTRRVAADGCQVLIASSDKDFMQLVSDRVGLINPSDKDFVPWDAARVRAKAGVGPAQIVDWLSLVGDSVDNIPGVPGVGAKTAAALLNQFGSVDELCRRLDEVPSERLRASLRLAEPDVRRNQQLIRLRDDLPLAAGLDQLRPRPDDPARLLALYRQWGFRGLVAELEEPCEPTAALLPGLT